MISVLCVVRRSAALSLLMFSLLAAGALYSQNPGWPRQFSNSSGKLVLYQPQVDDWTAFKQIDARSAFAVTPTGGKEQVGVVVFQMQTAVNMDDAHRAAE